MTVFDRFGLIIKVSHEMGCSDFDLDSYNRFASNIDMLELTPWLRESPAFKPGEDVKIVWLTLHQQP
jgi:hypothetical protein